MQNSKIDGAGVFLILKDQTTMQIYTILSRSDRKSGSYLQDLGGFLQSGKSFKQSAAQETFEESCGTLFINPDSLDPYLIINGKYMSFFCICELDVQKFFQDLKGLYKNNRSYLFEQQRKSGDYHIKCFLETNQLELILLSDLSEVINKTHRGKLALFNLEGAQLEIHRRTQSIIQQSGQLIKMIQPSFTPQDLLVSVNHTKTKILWGRKAIHMAKRQTNIGQNLSRETQESSTQVNIFLKDNKDMYMLLPVGWISKETPQNNNSPNVEARIIFACEQTFKLTHKTIIVKPDNICIEVIDGRQLFSVMTEIGGFVNFASFYAENERYSEESHFSSYEVVNLEVIKQMCSKKCFQLQKQGIHQLIDPNTVQDLQYYYRKGFLFLNSHKLCQIQNESQNQENQTTNSIIFGNF